MHALRLCLTLLLFQSVAAAQSSVDKVTRALDSLSTVSFDDWRVSPDLKRPVTGDPTREGFDDTKWDILKINQWIYPDSCWLRKEIVLPDRILGSPVSGKVKFLVSVDDYGYLWVNGVSKGYFPWDGEFELTKDAKPGEKFLLAIKAINTGGPLRLLRAQIELEAVAPMKRSIDDLSLSLRVGQKLLSFDTYQTNAHRKIDPGTDRSTMDRAEKTKLNADLQSLASRMRGASYMYTDGRPIWGLPDAFGVLGGGRIFEVPIPTIIMIIMYCTAYLILKRTRFGRYVYAVGGNQEAARLAGIDTNRVLMMVYIISGILSALSGMLLASRMNSGQPNAGLMYELDVIAAVVVGGTSLFGGRGSIIGTFVGAMLIGVLRNGLNLLNVGSYVQMVVLGVVILLAVMIDQMRVS